MADIFTDELASAEEPGPDSRDSLPKGLLRLPTSETVADHATRRPSGGMPISGPASVPAEGRVKRVARGDLGLDRVAEVRELGGEGHRRLDAVDIPRPCGWLTKPGA